MKVGEYKGLKATKKVNTVEDAAVEAEIKRMRERNARIITREGKAQDGDVTDIDFEGFVDGVAFEGGKGEHFSLTLGSGQFIPGFEEQVAGHEAGEEFEVNVTFPEQYQAEELAGKAATFKVKLHEVKTKELPAADDEFAKDVSEYDTLDELKASIRKGMEEQNEKNAELEVENDLVEQIVATLEGDIPVSYTHLDVYKRQGDARSASISAASILAKVSRDRYMEQLAKEYPQYQLEKHKGYPTKLHYALLDEYGIQPFYRRSFLKKRGYV